MLEAVDLACMRGDKRLFSGLSFRLEAGGLLFVHGPNGSGKTTLLRTLCGLSVPVDGEVQEGSSSLREATHSEREICKADEKLCGNTGGRVGPKTPPLHPKPKHNVNSYSH